MTRVRSYAGGAKNQRSLNGRQNTITYGSIRRMTSLERYVGEVLDEKYRLEHLLGQGGMGAVYLATHLGTERYVALKLITPQFMRNEEFVERFKREARAAGRLRHPNVVDVTDFGFAEVSSEQVAYLVMEYLDGCTLGDVLAEDQRLPLYWVVDILEQVCSAVHEAHQQGIVHRDLKPDNIWLEPNRLGSYRVKVLDFGIAKLADADSLPEPSAAVPKSPTKTVGSVSLDLESDTIIYPVEPARTSDDEERLGSGSEEQATRIMASDERLDLAEADSTRRFYSAAPAAAATHAPAAKMHLAKETDGDDKTRVFYQETIRTPAGGAAVTTNAQGTAATSGLTRVGAIMGTPTYMSPEQCRGERLDSRSDIYSLGVIAYQMLAGEAPFAGEVTTVMRAHIESPPRNLREQAPRLRKRVARVVMSALTKDANERPQTAAAFANSLRANADGLGTLYRRAFALYSEYFPKFLKLSLMAHIPVIVMTFVMLALRLAEPRMSKLTFGLLAVPVGLVQGVAQFVTASIISGVTAIIVTQLAAAPLKPVELRAAIDVLRQRWRPFLRTAIRICLRILLGWLLFIVPGLVMTVRYMLWAPVVLMEGLEKKAARMRARALASRSWRTIIIVTVIQFLIPIIVSSAIGAAAGLLSSDGRKSHETVMIKVGTQLSALVNIFVLPLMSIVPALLYLKMRQLGGETLNDVMAQIEEVEPVRSKWQQRMRTRLTLHTPQNQKQSGSLR